MLAGNCAHNRWKDEWDIIKVAGKISVEHRSVEEQLHGALFSSSLAMINNMESDRIATAILQIIDILVKTKSPIYFPFNSEVKVEQQRKTRKWSRMFCRIVLIITVITFIWSIGSNALGKGMSCCIAGDGHPLKKKPPV